MNDSALAAALQLHRNGNLGEAERLYRSILEKNPRHPDALHLLGMIADQVGQSTLAVQLIQAAIEVQPDASYYNNLGNVLEKISRREEAQASYRQAITLNPKYADAHYNLGLSYYRQSQLPLSIDAFRRAVECNEQLPAAWNSLGAALMDASHYPQAVTCLEKALSLSPDYAEAHLNLGNVLQKMGKNAEALPRIHRALSLKPDLERAWNTLGIIFDNMDAPGAIDCFRMALQYKSDYPEAMSNLGRLLTFTKESDEGLALLRRVTQLWPDYADGHWNFALALLLHGQYQEGWQEHEWRWRINDFSSPKRNFSQPQWQGEDLHGKKLLIHAEQGLGDTIQFSRFLPMVKASGAEIILEIRDSLRRLMAGIPEISQIVNYGDPLPEFDVHCPLMSLPHVFETTLDKIPPAIQFPSLADHRTGTSFASPLQVGLVWAGNPNHGLDRRRSVSIQALLPLKNISNVSYFCAFKGPAAQEVLAMAPQWQITDLCSDAEDLFDTAKKISQMDLIISVDTAVAHLAATMGRPVWLLVSQTPDWRWLCDREDSPWYPSIRIFRQRSLGNWDEVVAQIEKELTALAEEKRRLANEQGFRLNLV